MMKPALALCITAAIAAGGCTFSDVDTQEIPSAPIVITDMAGKEWDITTAVGQFGLVRDGFEGGLGVDAIPPFVDPQFLLPGQIGYPDSGESFLIVGTTFGGDVRAYRVDVFASNQVLDDEIFGSPVAVVYSAQEVRAALYGRSFSGQTVSLGASGWTYDGQIVIVDYETESLWFHLPDTAGLTCIAGEHVGQVLASLPFNLEPWSDWIALHTGSKVQRP